MKLFRFVFVVFIVLQSACQKGQEENKRSQDILQTKKRSESAVEKYVRSYTENSLPSQSIGSVSSGSMANGKLMPFNGPNFTYFDSTSYCSGRAFVHNKLKEVLLESYAQLDSLYPEQKFVLMECSKENGGPLPPHRTHQNGLSVDFASPLCKFGQPYYTLDTIGAQHYLLDFDKAGKLKTDTTVALAFDLIAHHILILNDLSKKHGLKVTKVIFNTDLQDDLKQTEHGSRIVSENIYLVRSLSSVINSLHDDHYHIDFQLTN